MLGCVYMTPAILANLGGQVTSLCCVCEQLACWSLQMYAASVAAFPTSCSFLLCFSVHHSTGLGSGMRHCLQHRPAPHLVAPHVRQDMNMPLLALCRHLPHLHRHPPRQVWRP